MKNRKFALASLLLLASVPVLFRALQKESVNLPITNHWARTSVSVIVALPLVALLLALLGLRFDRSKWLAGIAMLVSILVCWFFLITGLSSALP